MGRERDPTFRTADHVLLVNGMRVWDYDLLPGTVWFAGRDTASVYGDGWFQILRDDRSRTILNGDRSRTRYPFTGALVPTVVDDLAPRQRAERTATAPS